MVIEYGECSRIFYRINNCDEYLNKGVFSQELDNRFISNNILLSRNITINSASENSWNIFEKQYLFSIMDTALENDLNMIDITMSGEIIGVGVPKLKNIFASHGISLSENYRVWRIPEKWNIMDDMVNYEIWNQDGKLNVYTQEKPVYEILKEDGVLNVYDEYPGYIYFKIGEKNYRISFLWTD